MKRTIILASLIALTGCGSIPSGTFANRISCSLDKKQAYVNSLYGPIGITSKVHADDAAVACADKASPFRDSGGIAQVPSPAAGSAVGTAVSVVK